MKLSTSTQKVLSNFASINPGMVFEEGNVQFTISPLSTIVCQATLEESFPTSFAVYDMDTLLKIYSKIEDAELEFFDSYIKIKNAKSDMLFYFSDPQMIVVPGKKPYDHEDVVLRFALEDKVFAKIRSLVSIASCFKHLKIWSRDGHITLSLTNKESKERAVNQYTEIVRKLDDDDEMKDFEFYVQMDTLKILDGDYEFVIAKIQRNEEPIYILRLVNTTYNVKYWTALETLK